MQPGGCAISAVLIFGTFVALAGVQGAVQLAQLIRLYPGNLPATFAGSMMNWRALTINHALVLSPDVSRRLAMAGLAMSTVLGIALRVPAPSGVSLEERFRIGASDAQMYIKEIYGTVA
jgi:hypothetical protein